MINLPGNINGFISWTGNPPMRQLSADGAVFWGRNEKGANGTGPIYYTVYREAGGIFVPVFRSLINAGQGTLNLQGDGTLWLSCYMTQSEGAIAAYAQIVEYVPFTTQSNTALSARYKTALDRLCAWLGIP